MIEPAIYKPAKHVSLKTWLGKKIQSEIQGHSESVTPIFVDLNSQYGGDAFETLMIDYNLNNLKEKNILDTRKEIYEISQDSLKHRGLPEIFPVFRYGNITTSSHGVGVTAVTLSPSVAYSGAKRGNIYGKGNTPIHTYMIRRSDVLIDIDAIFGGIVMMEEELIVRPGDLKEVNTHFLESVISKVVTEVLKEVYRDNPISTVWFWDDQEDKYEGGFNTSIQARNIEDIKRESDVDILVNENELAKYIERGGGDVFLVPNFMKHYPGLGQTVQLHWFDNEEDAENFVWNSMEERSNYIRNSNYNAIHASKPGLVKNMWDKLTKRRNVIG